MNSKKNEEEINYINSSNLIKYKRDIFSIDKNNQRILGEKSFVQKEINIKKENSNQNRDIETSTDKSFSKLTKQKTIFDIGNIEKYQKQFAITKTKGKKVKKFENSSKKNIGIKEDINSGLSRIIIKPINNYINNDTINKKRNAHNKKKKICTQIFKKKIFVVIIILNLFCLININYHPKLTNNNLKKHPPKLSNYNNWNNHTNLSYLDKKFDPISIAFEKAKVFIKECLSSDLIKYQTSSLLVEPIVSVVTPLYNCERYILRAVKSAQLQNISDIEIILVDDKSTDDTLTIVEKIQKEDKRIKVIKNQNNMGILYSRSIGVLSAKGKYIFSLDNDDIFLDKDVFDKITFIAENGNFDIVEFKAISNKILNEDLLNNIIIDAEYSHQKSFILFQPQLGRFPISTDGESSNYKLQDIFLWGKCIKTIIYQDALNKFGFDKYSRYMIRVEDILMNYIISNTAKSFIFVKKYGIYHLMRRGSGTIAGFQKVPRSANLLYLIDAITEFSQQNHHNKKLEVNVMIQLLKINGLKKYLDSNNDKKELIISCLQKIMNSTYTSEIDKNRIKHLFNNIK